MYLLHANALGVIGLIMKYDPCPLGGGNWKGNYLNKIFVNLTEKISPSKFVLWNSFEVTDIKLSFLWTVKAGQKISES